MHLMNMNLNLIRLAMLYTTIRSRYERDRQRGREKESEISESKMGNLPVIHDYPDHFSYRCGDSVGGGGGSGFTLRQFFNLKSYVRVF